MVSTHLFLMAAMVTQPQGIEEHSQETLYNGIGLSSPWPPRDNKLSLKPMPVPYLSEPPDVIPIDVGRQLFVDDFLIETTDLARTYYSAQLHPESPVLQPDQPWESEGKTPTAMVFSDGVWFDPKEKLFKMWYMGGYCVATCYTTSQDGIHWEKPSLDVVKGTNIVERTPRDSATVWMDLEEENPYRRYKLFMYTRDDHSGRLSIYFSKDGIHWSDPVARSGPCGDRSTVFRNPFRDKWVYSIREYFGGGLGRVRRYWEDGDVPKAAQWEKGEPPEWVGADGLDAKRVDLNVQPELYNLDAVAYESLMVGLFSIWRGQPEDRAKPNEVLIGFSRDGFHWDRPYRCPFVPVSERHGDWNWANVQSAGGGCLIVGNELWFYVSGRAGEPGSKSSGVSSTGLAVLRRDGFASMDSYGPRGSLTTRKVCFSGKRLFVNADAQGGELAVEILNGKGDTMAPFSAKKCILVRKNSTLQQIQWKGGEDLSSLAGQAVRFRFHLKNARLFSFWVSQNASGKSGGYVAAGGPGFKGVRDE